MTQVNDFEHGPFQVVCIASPRGAVWSSAAMLMRLDSREFDDRPRWFAHDLPSPGAALADAERRARALIDRGEWRHDPDPDAVRQPERPAASTPLSIDVATA